MNQACMSACRPNLGKQYKTAQTLDETSRAYSGWDPIKQIMTFQPKISGSADSKSCKALQAPMLFMGCVQSCCGAHAAADDPRRRRRHRQMRCRAGARKQTSVSAICLPFPIKSGRFGCQLANMVTYPAATGRYRILQKLEHVR